VNDAVRKFLQFQINANITAPFPWYSIRWSTYVVLSVFLLFFPPLITDRFPSHSLLVSLPALPHAHACVVCTCASAFTTSMPASLYSTCPCPVASSLRHHVASPSLRHCPTVPPSLRRPCLHPSMLVPISASSPCAHPRPCLHSKEGCRIIHSFQAAGFAIYDLVCNTWASSGMPTLQPYQGAFRTQLVTTPLMNLVLVVDPNMTRFPSYPYRT